MQLQNVQIGGCQALFGGVNCILEAEIVFGVFCLDGLIRVNRSGFPNRTPFFCESRFGGLKIANRRFEAIRANRSNVTKIEVFLRIDSRGANRRAI